ncbi:DoxX family protein [Candidatus Woesearchaeota archaeon]|nr:DoxX family protein [Candidatus Woesearchaeota archaeon]
MLHKLNNWLSGLEDWAYLGARVLVGLMFFLHGWQKLSPLVMGGDAPGGLMLVAGIVELVGGLAVAFGFLTQLASFLSAGQMLVAYVMVHASGGWNPLVNKGELALMYFAAFAVFATMGGRKWSLDEWMGR